MDRRHRCGEIIPPGVELQAQYARASSLEHDNTFAHRCRKNLPIHRKNPRWKMLGGVMFPTVPLPPPTSPILLIQGSAWTASWDLPAGRGLEPTLATTAVQSGQRLRLEWGLLFVPGLMAFEHPQGNTQNTPNSPKYLHIVVAELIAVEHSRKYSLLVNTSKRPNHGARWFC